MYHCPNALQHIVSFWLPFSEKNNDNENKFFALKFNTSLSNFPVIHFNEMVDLKSHVPMFATYVSTKVFILQNIASLHANEQVSC